jgi:hypothetical protein
MTGIITGRDTKYSLISTWSRVPEVKIPASGTGVIMAYKLLQTGRGETLMNKTSRANKSGRVGPRARERRLNMLLFQDEKDSYLLADATEEVLKKFWDIYHAYRYDMYVSFVEYLRGNGVCVKKVSPRNLGTCGYRFSEITISLN